MDIKPIRTEADYEAALEEIERLFNAEPDTPESDQLEVLVTLVEAYEETHYPIPPPDPIEAIEYHMESRGLARRDLEPYIGSRARVSEILNRRRPLSINMIRRLEAGLGIPAEVLIQPYELVRAEGAAIDGQRYRPVRLCANSHQFLEVEEESSVSVLSVSEAVYTSFTLVRETAGEQNSFYSWSPSEATYTGLISGREGVMN